jgi:hypothetical protein
MFMLWNNPSTNGSALRHVGCLHRGFSMEKEMSERWELVRPDGRVLREYEGTFEQACSQHYTGRRCWEIERDIETDKKAGYIWKELRRQIEEMIGK